jgi:hypothetical protein
MVVKTEDISQVIVSSDDQEVKSGLKPTQINILN